MSINIKVVTRIIYHLISTIAILLQKYQIYNSKHYQHGSTCFHGITFPICLYISQRYFIVAINIESRNRCKMLYLSSPNRFKISEQYENCHTDDLSVYVGVSCSRQPRQSRQLRSRRWKRLGFNFTDQGFNADHQIAHRERN